ncbi:MAG: dihydroxyacetone kinase subunit L [Verrucomicrobiales bacterium]|nr:dihydroxyacetone kinase subunit L [Verrucomicrobiales bacterium]
MPKSSLSSDQVKEMLLQVADAIIAAEPRLSEADRNLGDGDHGLGMQRGMTAGKEKLQELEAGTPIDKVFSSLGMAMMSSMGGASGAIFGSYFRAGGKALAGQEVFDSASLAGFLRAGVDGVKQRGGAKVGDKTAVDSMEPAAEKAAESTALPLPEAAAAAADAAIAGMEASKDMIAQFGRAKTLGEGCLGHPDAGAMSITVILGAMRDYIQA